MNEITEAVAALNAGEPEALAALFSTAYPELKRLAHSRLYAANLRNGIATESLLHETFLKLCHVSQLDVPSRKQFFGYASTVMRNIILDEIRSSKAERRGSGQAEVTLNTELAEISPAAMDIEAVEDALTDLAKISPELAKIVELRFFGGLTESEIGQVLGVSERTVRREWEKARAALVVLIEE
jgi:RNA polymerase sigma factor (TIGR02999 family)